MSSAIIHVNRQHIAMNSKNGTELPVFTIKSAGKIKYAQSVEILGNSKMVYSSAPLSCGAKAWIETEAPLILNGETTFAQARGRQPKKTNCRSPRST